MPWKNGLGTTTEIVRVDDEDGELLWRVSVADVASDGPFSSFAGYDRVIATIEGAGMIIAHPTLGRSARLGALEPYAFSGDWETGCALVGGPVRDFNLITRRGRIGGTVDVMRLAPGERRELRHDSTDATLVYVVGGVLRVGTRDGERDVSAGDSALATAAGELSHLAATDANPAVALVVTLSAPAAPAAG
jgi:uncharacterized protein